MKPLPLKPLLQVQVRALTGLVQSASLLQPPLLTLHEGAPEKQHMSTWKPLPNVMVS
jgi:hypothetical protein